MPSNENGHVNYFDFMKIINWREYPANPLSTTPATIEEYNGAPHKDQIKKVNLALFMADLKQG